MMKELMEKYRWLKEHNFETEAEKVWTEEYIYNIFDNLTREDFEKEIDFLDDYIHYLKIKYHQLFEYDEEESEYAFSPQELYRLWLEKDEISLYSVLADCTDEYIQEVLNCWISREYEKDAILLLANYKNKREAFRGDTLEDF